jgi:hypothetical protein
MDEYYDRNQWQSNPETAKSEDVVDDGAPTATNAELFGGSARIWKPQFPDDIRELAAWPPREHEITRRAIETGSAVVDLYSGEK